MALPPHELQRVEALLRPLCAARSRPTRTVDFKVRGNSVTLFELVPSFISRSGPEVDIVVAQFRFDPVRLKWSLHCADRNSRWHPFLDAEATRNLKLLLDEVIEDRTGIFWG